LGGWDRGTPASWLPATNTNGRRCTVQYKATEQAHVTLAVRGIPLGHPDRHAMSFLSVILGEGMSSRLFMELREKRGLVYDVSGWMGVQELLLGKVRAVEDIVDEMDAVTIEDLQRLAREIIDPRKCYLAVVGPYRSDKRFASLLPT